LLEADTQTKIIKSFLRNSDSSAGKNARPTSDVQSRAGILARRNQIEGRK